MRLRLPYLLFILLFLSTFCRTAMIWAQNADQAQHDPPPTGFGEIQLGLSFADAEAALKRDPNFSYRGKADVSMLRNPNERMIETGGLGFIRRAYLQFHDDRLYSIVLDIDEQLMDHYALYTTFVGKYGPPNVFTPDESRWKGDTTAFILERKGLRVKYLDTKLLDEIRRSGAIDRSFEEMTRDQFLQQF
ncbi:hypothetical protein [Sediminispirochaeta bajacaliforniensis]|uniref:hypothetical protein n=1 Tax=Sediminispirochaeta bajacaliforniensis TaxID=148 RepID=UPI000366CB57|nr:hypothetical protein [Sediminispirochaeta bajacaliforniensis]